MWVDLPGWQPVTSFSEPVTPPGTDPAAAPLVCIAVNATWLPYIVGALMQLVQPAAWATSDPTVLQTTLENATELISLFGTAEDCTMLTFRFTDTCVLQFSLDGGTTWEDVSGWPTYAPGCYTGATGPTGPEGPPGGFTPGVPPIQPGQTTADLACAVAGYIASAVIQAALSQAISAVTTGETVLQLVTAIFGVIPGVDVIVPEITGALAVVYNAITSGDVSHYESAESDPVLWGDVTCAIYTATSGDGYVTAGNFSAVLAGITAISYTYPDVVATLAAYVSSLGAAGLEALQIPGAVASVDCSGCGGPSEWCYTFNFLDSDYGFTDQNNPADSEWVSGVGWRSKDAAGGQYLALGKTGFSGVFTSCEAAYTLPANADAHTVDSYPSSGYINVSIPNTAGAQNPTVAFAGTWTSVRIVLEIFSLTGSHIVITSLTYRGTGTNPFGANNCI